MNQQLLNTLSAKSTDELKDYVSNMNNGYTQEAVEIAIHILKERGEDVDKLLRAAQVSICETCQQRKQTSAGLICTLSDKKADFIGSCPNYEPDESAIAEVERNTQINSEWGGMMNFYLFILGIGAALTAVMACMSFDKSTLFLSLSDLVMMLGYSAVCVYTIIAFAKRLPNAVTLGKIQNYTLIAMNSLALISNIVYGSNESDWYNGSIRLASSIVWAIIFLSYLYGNEQIKAIFPKKSRHMLKYDKPIILSILGLVVALFIAGVFEEAKKEADRPFRELQTYIEASNNAVEEDKSASFYVSGYELSDSTVIVKYKSNSYANADLPSILINTLSILSREVIFHQPSEIDQYLIELCYAADCGISLDWYDSNNKYTYSVSFSSHDVNSIYENIHSVYGTTQYKTPEHVWDKFINIWNEQLPTVYLQDDLVYTRAEVNGNKAIINLVFQGWSASDLQAITNTYLKEYLIDIFDDLTDQYITLAKLNKMDICYRFTSDASLFWQEDVIFTPEEYINK